VSKKGELESRFNRLRNCLKFAIGKFYVERNIALTHFLTRKSDHLSECWGQEEQAKVVPKRGCFVNRGSISMSSHTAMPNVAAARFRSARSAVIATTVISALMFAAIPFAQQAPAHLNPVIEKLAQGKPFFGVSTSDLSFVNAHMLARADIDYVYVDMEHEAPMDFEALRSFSVNMIDKAAILKKRNAQPNVALFARFTPYGREHCAWVIEEALDIGLMGIIFNGVDNKEQALFDVENMRYPQPRGSAYPYPPGLRGFGAHNAFWFWGIPEPEYTRRADLWPLNPQGDLLAIMMIETAEGLKNVDEIAAVPGVGAIFVGQGGDLHEYLGVPQDSPELEVAFQKILHACLAHNVVCGMTIKAKDMPRRIREGWKMLGVGHASGGISPENDAALRAGRAALK
jgi:4-hydroxy-2-oxoheptanedioate aldolase